ncbi:hypothetical protein AJ89_14520 (plasmid) [Lactococcus cremoris subsp. cremoris IBB477]|uniref:Uncharacterized protein n=1 Tax=Lactococcus cremoris subsp. cremoris IBB477 TaxID=1449093 RepID=A0A1E7G091_LACLC|nr:DUF3800 domain-containing protein [Lactococcus cremoris]OEU38376.1 hypothetical protein AJ89_14520 [Lactococcus cremoris subsp. cremoris IBB477]
MESFRDIIIQINGLNRESIDKKYRMFFDETKNVRKFRLTESGFNSDEKQFFVLGGLVSDVDVPLESINELWNSIPQSKTQDELKFNTIRQGAKTFPELLNKLYFQKVIDWLIENKYWIHFHYMDNFYYSIVDIIDSLPFASKLGNILDSRHYKTALYQAIRLNKNKSLDIFRDNTYPDVKDSVSFLSSIEELLEVYIESDEYEAYYYDKEDNSFEIIQEEIKKAKNQELPFLVNNREGELIEEYYQLYYQNIILFKNSYLIFDHEVDVEDRLAKMDIKSENYRFVESSIPKANEKSEFVDERTHKLVQLSDILVGAMSMFLEYLNSDDTGFLKDIYEATKWSKKQCDTFDKWVAIINDSVVENEAFKSGVVDEFLEYKYNFFTGNRFVKGGASES